MSWLTRRRLDVPEVHDLIGAQSRMLDNWSETAPLSDERARYWRELHAAADALAARAYGGPTVATQLSYWLRPYDARLDRRMWRWLRPGPCRVLDLTTTPPPPAGRTTTGPARAGTEKTL